VEESERESYKSLSDFKKKELGLNQAPKYYENKTNPDFRRENLTTNID